MIIIKKKTITILVAIILILLTVLIYLLTNKIKQNKDEKAILKDNLEINNHIDYNKDNTNNVNDENTSNTNNINESDMNYTKNNEIDEEKTPMKTYGKLNVSGTNLVSENGEIVKLKGISTHGISWFPQYINKETFKFMRDEWNVNLIRLAVYSENYNESQNKIIEDGIDYLTNLGMYVILDWHTLNDNNPNTNKEKAKTFFSYFANKYKNNVNIIYEVCNEPNGNVTWQNDIKPYEEEMIEFIRNINNDVVILCGTPNYCQDLQEVEKSPITKYQNIMYTLHFYAATHKQELRNKLSSAIEKGLPVFVSEFGISEANGDNSINIDEANKWMKLLNDNNINFVYWNLSNKNEACSLLKSTINTLSGWNIEDLSESGKWYINTIKK